MRAIGSKLNMYVRSVTLVNNDAERAIFNIILWSFGVLALLYILFLGNMVKDIVGRKSLEARVSTLSNEVRDLELDYLALSNNIDLDFSYSLGFKDAKTTFTAHKSVGLISPSSDKVKTVHNDL
jgi:hypothetical protein